MFIGSKHCPRCGAAAAETVAADLPTLKCPRCRVEMQSLVIGATQVRECAQCEGLWVDVTSFERICADREQQAVMLGTASLTPVHPAYNEQGQLRALPGMRAVDEPCEFREVLGRDH